MEQRRNYHIDRPETIHQKDLKILKLSTFMNVVLRYMKENDQNHKIIKKFPIIES